jgi:methylated-DNA-[protein]-cysteine S-methyltransferase
LNQPSKPTGESEESSLSNARKGSKMPVTLIDLNEEAGSKTICYGYFASPIGLIEIGGCSVAITSVNFVEHQRPSPGKNPLVSEAVDQISAYFNGSQKMFDLCIAPGGTRFQQSVWRQLTTVAYGHTASYQDIAKAVGNPRAVRAVGGANGRNPLAIVVPCHRIIGKNGGLTGYGSGLWRKQWLLRHEGVAV